MFKGILLVAGAVLWFIPYCIFGWMVNIGLNNQWNRTVYSEWTLSDQSSTIDKKLDHLKKFKEALVREGLDHGQARYVFTTPSTDLGNNMEVLDSLIQRLEDTQKLSATSLEYQQAIRQITVDEYQGFNTCVFAEGWQRKNLWRFYNTPFITCQKGEYAGSSD